MPLDIGGFQINSDMCDYFNPPEVVAAVEPLVVEYLVIAGGGGAGNSSWSGGGGAGGYRSSVSGEMSGGGASAESTLSLSTGTAYNVTIGAGGNPRVNGSNSCFHTICSRGGGMGGHLRAVACDGGSGGGGGNDTPNGYGQGTAGQGYRGEGGDEGYGGTRGGGGGAGTIGGGTYTAGGDGVQSNITGTNLYRAGGGGGEWSNPGLGTGADGGRKCPADPNTGGGGHNDGNAHCPGGSGVVILRYPTGYTLTGSGVTICTNTVGSCQISCIISGTGTVTFS
jgi:hypothetical protein